MAGFSSEFANDLLKRFLNGTPIAGIADNAAAGALTNLYIALHTGDPGQANAQTTREAAYAGYARGAVPRSTAGFSAASGGTALLMGNADFAKATGPATTITHFSIGTAAAGGGRIIGSGQLDNPIEIKAGVIPRIESGSSFTLVDLG
jgi:hypothetical protein